MIWKKFTDVIWQYFDENENVVATIHYEGNRFFGCIISSEEEKPFQTLKQGKRWVERKIAKGK